MSDQSSFSSSSNPSSSSSSSSLSMSSVPFPLSFHSSSFSSRSTSALEAVIDAALLLSPYDSMEYAVRVNHDQQLQHEMLMQQQQLQQHGGGGAESLSGIDPELMKRLLVQYHEKATKARGQKKSKRVRSPKENKHGRWSPEEDMRLAEIVPKVGVHSWVEIAGMLTIAMNKNHGQDLHGPQRSCKQCRQRWTNFLDPSVRHTQWTKEEDEKIMEMVKQFGHKWSDISRQLNGRSELLVKNRWYSSVRKIAELEGGLLVPMEGTNYALLGDNIGNEDDGDAVEGDEDEEEEEEIEPSDRASKTRKQN